MPRWDAELPVRTYKIKKKLSRGNFLWSFQQSAFTEKRTRGGTKEQTKTKKIHLKNIKSQKTQVPAKSCVSSSIHTCKHYMHERKKKIKCIACLTKTKLPRLSHNLKFRFSSHCWHKYCNSMCNAFLQNYLNDNFKHGVRLLNDLWRCFPFYEVQSVNDLGTIMQSALSVEVFFKSKPNFGSALLFWRGISGYHAQFSSPWCGNATVWCFPRRRPVWGREEEEEARGCEDEDVKVNGRWRLIFSFFLFFRNPSPRLHETAHIQQGLIKCQPEPPTVQLVLINLFFWPLVALMVCLFFLLILLNAHMNDPTLY